MLRTDAAREIVIEARQLVKRFGEFTAVGGVDFTVPRGEIFGFLGPNGSGKTTTIRMLLGLLRPSQGEMRILGVDVGLHPEVIRPRVGYMSQQFSLYNDLTVAQNLRFYGAAYGLSTQELASRMTQALEMAGLEGREHVRTRELAGGWRQRLALGAAILHQPEVIFLDEPTAGVDPVSRRAFWDLLYRLVAQGVSMFVTTHYMDEAEHCHRLAFIQNGLIIAHGSPEQIKREMMPGQVIEIASTDAEGAVRQLRALAQRGRFPISTVELYGSLVRIVTPGAAEHIPAIAAELRGAGVDPGTITAVEPTLEDVFIACMR